MNDDQVMALSFGPEVGTYLFPDSLNLESKIDNISFLLFSNGNDISSSDADKITKAIARDGYEPLLKARSNGQNIELLGLENDDHISAIYTQIVFEDKIGYFLLGGKIRYEDLSRLNFDNTGSMLKNIGNVNWD